MEKLAQLFGKVSPPPGVSSFGGVTEGGLTSFLNTVLKLLIVFAGVYAVFNLVTAGYGFMSAGDDPKKVAAAWGKIWRTLIGLLLAVGAFVLAALFGQILFGDPNALLQIKLFGPTAP